MAMVQVAIDTAPLHNVAIATQMSLALITLGLPDWESQYVDVGSL